VPFLFNSPLPQTPHKHAWTPPPNFSPTKAFPQEELKDVDMPDVSPPKSEYNGGDGARAVALGAVKRIFKSRQKALRVAKKRLEEDERDERESDESENGGDGSPTDSRESRIRRMSTHYTLNMPSPAVPHSETPYVLLG